MSDEVCQVRRLQDEMENERMTLLEKRRQEKEYLQRMLKENEREQEKARFMANNEKQADIAAQLEYAAMLDQQEADRMNEMQQREKRAQDF